MRHAVIVAHPDPRSFNRAVARAYQEAAEGEGHEVVMRDLYHIGFDPCLHADELPWAKGYRPRPDVLTERSLLAEADAFVLVYPLWFNAPPAMLKGYIDRVFGMGFGYGAESGGSAPLLTGRSLVSFTSSGAPDRWVEDTGAVTALRRAFDDHVAAMSGMAVLDHIHFGGVTPGLRADAVGDMLGAVRGAVRRLFGPSAA